MIYTDVGPHKSSLTTETGVGYIALHTVVEDTGANNIFVESYTVYLC